MTRFKLLYSYASEWFSRRDGTRDWPFLVIYHVTKIHMIYPFIGRRIFEVAILQAHKIVHPHLLSSFLVSSSLSRLEDLCEVLGKWQAKARILFRGGGEKNAKKRKYYLDVSIARKNFKTCDKNLILYLQKGTMDLFRSVILLRFHPLLSKVLKIYLKIEFLHSSILRGFEAVLKN